MSNSKSVFAIAMSSKTSPSPETRSGRPATAQTIQRTLDVLEVLAGREGAVGVGELAKELDVSNASAHRLLSTLESRGYARQDPATAKYSVGLSCFSLASLATSHVDLRAITAPFLRRLNELTGEAVHLALYDDGEVVYIDRAEGTHPVGPISKLGARAPAHCVATGRAILAYLPTSEFDALVADGLPRYTDSSPATREQLEADRALTLRRGYAINEGSWREGISGVAAPVRDHTGVVRGSIGVCLPDSRFTDEARPLLVEHTVNTAAEVSAELGFVVPAEPPARQARGQDTRAASLVSS
jgi:DNA-binding IclR family transcriptional regulator